MHTNFDQQLPIRFLRMLNPNNGAVTYQTFQDRKDAPKDPSLIKIISGLAKEQLLDLHARGAGIYVTVNQTDGAGRKKENITRIRAVWREADNPNLPALPIEPSLVVETSPGHCHEYFLVRGDWPANEEGEADFTGVMDRMVETYGSDKSAKDICRVLRVPGFLHRKTSTPHLVHITGGSGRRYSRAEILAAFPPIPRKKPEPKRDYTPRDNDEQRIADALNSINADDRDVWLECGMALKAELGDAGRYLWDEWSLKSGKYDEADQEKVWRSFQRNGIGLGTVFHRAKQSGWQEPSRRLNGAAPPAGKENEFAPTEAVSLEQFHAYMPGHNYIYMPTRELWPGASVNSRLGKIPIFDGNGKQVLDDNGKPKSIPASTWLDQNRPIEQMTWSPGSPAIILDKFVADGGWINHPGARLLNLYRPPRIIAGDATLSTPWRDHIRRVYPNEAGHIIQWLAQRVQRPQEKINHALVLGGKPGIGKDTALEPVKHAVGPWNFVEVSPQQVVARFNGFAKSVILRISEARDLGDINRYQFYDHMKVYAAAPPDVLRVDEKNLREHSVFNCCGVIITTNYKADGIYLPPDDRRHFVAWSDLSKDDFPEGYWTKLWRWYEGGGYRHVAAYLAELDLSSFDPKAPPPKTEAFWAIVNANKAPEYSVLADALDRLNNPPVVTIARIKTVADADFTLWLLDKKNSKAIPHRMEDCGYVPVRNKDAGDGYWKIGDTRQSVYARSELSPHDQLAAVATLRST